MRPTKNLSLHGGAVFTWYRESKIGTMLPCNVIVQELEDGCVEVAAVDPIASMQAVENEALGKVAVEVQAKLRKVVDNLSRAIASI